MKLKIRMEKQWNEDDGTKRKSEDVSKKGREGEKFDFPFVLKLELINQFSLLKLLDLLF